MWQPTNWPTNRPTDKVGWKTQLKISIFTLGNLSFMNGPTRGWRLNGQFCDHVASLKSWLQKPWRACLGDHYEAIEPAVRCCKIVQSHFLCIFEGFFMHRWLLLFVLVQCWTIFWRLFRVHEMEMSSRLDILSPCLNQFPRASFFSRVHATLTRFVRWSFGC